MTMSPGCTQQHRRPEHSWSAYTASREEPWNLRRVVHLHRRAGFAAKWNEIQRDLAEGPRASVDRLLTGRARIQGVPGDFERTSACLRVRRPRGRDATRLRAWWIHRMLFTPDPLTERLVLLWHNHFATNNDKVQNAAAMRQQNDEFRELAKAPLQSTPSPGHALAGASVWLDSPANRRDHPNENLAREVMELFTLGMGNVHRNRRPRGRAGLNRRGRLRMTVFG